MTTSNLADPWSDRIRQTLGGYDEGLLRAVATRLCKPRNQWPASELVDRCLATLDNPAVLDRRLKELEPAARQVLALIAMSRQPRWAVGSLVEMLVALGHDDGLAPVRALLEGGLLYPETVGSTGGNHAAGKTGLRRFDSWLAQQTRPIVYAPPAVTRRCQIEPLPIDISGTKLTGAAHEADGLEWPLRLAVFWQQAAIAPLRRTQQRDFFKRDLDRLRNDSLLNAAFADPLTDLPDVALLAAAWGLVTGLVSEEDSELRAAVFPEAWQTSLAKLIAELWSALPHVEGWNAGEGWTAGALPGNPHAAANLLALAALVALPADEWARPEAIDAWIVAHHPFWASGAGSSEARRKGTDQTPVTCGAAKFLLGVAYPLRLLEACKDKTGGWCVRLSALGRWALGREEAPPAVDPGFPQTLLVQPNLEMLAYRQGLTPPLIVKLTHFARWQTLGAACTLYLEPASAYRALEAGETFETITQTLDRHGMKPTPVPVLEALKTWSNKRERISVWPEAVLLEFAGPAELNDALARGLPAVRLTDRLAAVARESGVDFKHFRLTGTRDYCLPPERCVDIEPDGVTLSVDPARSDLLLETELLRFAAPFPEAAVPGRKLYRVTPASLQAARRAGLHVDDLSEWFQRRTGLPLPPAARMLLTGAEAPPPELRRQLVLHVLNPELADGLMQWPTTANLIQARLGPTTLAVAEQNAAVLQARLQEIGIRMQFGEG